MPHSSRCLGLLATFLASACATQATSSTSSSSPFGEERVALQYGRGRLDEVSCAYPLGFSVLSAEGTRAGEKVEVEFEVVLSNPHDRPVALDPTFTLVSPDSGETLSLTRQRRSRSSEEEVENADGGVVVLAVELLREGKQPLARPRAMAPHSRARTAWLTFSGELAPGAARALELNAGSRAGERDREACRYAMLLERSAPE